MTPPELKAEFLKLNVAPLFSRITVDQTMIDPKMAKMVESNRFKLPSEQLSMVFHAKDYMLTSAMLKMYLEWGLIVTRVHSGLEYQPAKPFIPFINLVTEGRIKATEQGNSVKGNMYKLCANSSYGRMGKKFCRIDDN